jgi:hypothetical protein
VLAYGRLTIQELGALLQMEDNKVYLALEELHSVIHVPDGNGTIRAFHLSFHDFLTNQDRCINQHFFIDAPMHHTEIARCCLETMVKLLHRDMCKIHDISKLNHEVDDLEKRKTEFLPGNLQYACRFWALHLSNSLAVEPLLELIWSFVSTSILYWIEALSVIGELGGGLKSLRTAQAKLLVSYGLSLY